MSGTVEARTYSRRDSVVFRKTSEKFGGLSNMAPGFPLEVEGIRILTAEALYQACRFPQRPEIQRLIIQQRSPMTAKMKSKPHRTDTRPDWNRVRVNIMRWCLRVKLAQNWQKFSALLRATGDRPVVEESRKDDFWGAKPVEEEMLIGGNVLGRLLMELREELQDSDIERFKRIEPLSIPQFLLYGEPIGIVGSPRRSPLEDAELFEKPIMVGTRAIPKECKRVAEVDFPIAVVSKHAAAEKEARCGHIPKIHIWPAARPTGACRAVLMGLLLPDPCDKNCPKDFKEKARELLLRAQGKVDDNDEDLQRALLKFVGDFASWDLSFNRRYVEIARELVRSAHGNDPPLAVDPFAGGGSIPLEALRLGCEAFASDLNPVACLILKVMLEDIPRHGPELADQLRQVGAQIKEAAKKGLAEFYPPDPDGARPIAYLWARTVRCESPNCGAEIPLVRSFWLCKKANRKWALRYKVVSAKGELPRVEFEIFEPKNADEVSAGTVTRAKARCLCCDIVLSPDRVRAQLSQQRGGADVIFDGRGSRVGGARLLAIVTLKPGQKGRHYRRPTHKDHQAVWKAQKRLKDILDEWERGGKKGLRPVPDEPTPAGGGSGAGRAFSVQKYGMMEFSHLFTARQKVALATFSRLLDSLAHGSPALEIAALCVSKMVDMNNNLATWQPHAEIPAHMLTRFAIPMKWDFAEAVPISDSSGTLESAIKRSIEPLRNLSVVDTPGTVQQADATSLPLPDQSGDIWFTDPPYYDAVPYADLSDFFFVWLKRSLRGHPLLRDPFDHENPLTPKRLEAIQDEIKEVNGRAKDRTFFEEVMARTFAEGRRVLKEHGVGCVVFAHKTTEGWEALLSGMTQGGWVITGSWPIATEMSSRLRARESAALATSVHLVCRPRPKGAAVGDWGEVLQQLPKRVGDWMERLQNEGIRGADLVFACIGRARGRTARIPREGVGSGWPDCSPANTRHCRG